MMSKCTCKNLTILILIASLFTTLIVLILFQENIVRHVSSVKLKHSQIRQVVEIPTIIVHSSTRQSFAKLMHSFPWIPFKIATIQNDTLKIKKYSELLLTSILIPFVIKEPPTPVNPSCKAPLLPSKPEKCISPKSGSSPKIGVILNFSFDVDALEVHLHELDFLVDKFFLVEGLKINNRIMDTKPSIWDLVKYTTRFSQFQSKIVHFVVDDADYHEGPLSPGLWDRESLHKKLRLKKFLEWNNAAGHFSADDWIGIGDTDEIPSRQAINMLKNCEMKGDRDVGVHIGIWFPFPYDDTIYASDYPVAYQHPYTLGNPTYWKVSAVEKIYKSGNRTGRRGGRGNQYLLGGMHFSLFPYLPFQLTKLLTGSESEVKGISWAVDIGMEYLNGSKGDVKVDDVEESVGVEMAAQKKWEELNNISNERIISFRTFRRRHGNKERDDIVKIPWFYQCNPGRYLGFKRKLDKRLF